MLSHNMRWIAYFGSIDLALYVLLEVARSGNIELQQIDMLRKIALQEGNSAFCVLLDFYNNGTLERLSDLCLALTSHILSNAFSVHPFLRARRAAPHAPRVLDWSQGLYAPRVAPRVSDWSQGMYPPFTYHIIC